MVNKAAPFCQPCGVTLPTVYEGQSCPHCDSELGSRSAKMSKSLGNTVSPEDMIARYGADTVRLFILFAANPTAGMDWSDAALDANHRVVVQMRGMPEQLLGWSEGASPMDGWLEARFSQRVHEFAEAMETYDLRRAVEISHYDVIKDINWYTRRGGQNVEVARRWLPLWAQMVSVSTPHLAEEWWAALDGTNGLVAGSTMAVPAALSEAQQTLLDGEQYIRDVLEQARKVRVVAERHLGQPATEATFVVSPAWKRSMAQAALAFIHDGGHPKQFIPILQELLAQGERKGEMMGFWARKCCLRSSSGTMHRRPWSLLPLMRHRCSLLRRTLSQKNFNSTRSMWSLAKARMTVLDEPVQPCRSLRQLSTADQASSSIAGRGGGAVMGSGWVFGSGGPGRCALV